MQQVEGPTADQALRVDVMLPSVNPDVLMPFLPEDLKSKCASLPAGPIAIEFNGPDHYLVSPSQAATGAPPPALSRKAL